MSEQINPKRKLGRAPRAFNQDVPHFSSMMMMAKRLPTPPDEVHWTKDLGISDYGMMLNSELGCCTIATAFHMMQVWSGHGRARVLTEADEYVLQTYKEFTGYNGTPETDNGAVEQDILKQWLVKGVPIREGTETNPNPGRSHIIFYCEVDKRDIEDVFRAINDCGGVYIGFLVPAWLMQESILPELWDRNVNENIVGGHAVSLHGYNTHDETFDLISWGKQYKMSFSFFSHFVDEVYAVCHPWFVNKEGRTPLGLSTRQLEDLMKIQLATK